MILDTTFLSCRSKRSRQKPGVSRMNSRDMPASQPPSGPQWELSIPRRLFHRSPRFLFPPQISGESTRWDELSQFHPNLTLESHRDQFFFSCLKADARRFVVALLLAKVETPARTTKRTTYTVLMLFCDDFRAIEKPCFVVFVGILRSPACVKNFFCWLQYGHCDIKTADTECGRRGR